MQRLICASLCTVALLICAYAGADPVIIYSVDAANGSGRFQQALPTLKYNDTLIIRLVNVNTIRNRYTITCKTIDTHATSVPNALSTLVLMGSTTSEAARTPSYTEEADETKKTNDTKVQFELSNEGRAVNELYTKVVNPTFQAAQQAYLDESRPVKAQSSLLSNLVCFMQHEDTNIKIRSNSVRAATDFFKATRKEAQQPKPPVVIPPCRDYAKGALNTYLTEVSKPININISDWIAAKKAWDAAKQNWDETYSAWDTAQQKWDAKTQNQRSPEISKLKSMDQAVNNYDEEIKKDNTDVNNLQTASTQIAKAIRYNFALIADTTITPPVIEKFVKADKDCLNIQIDIDYVPLVTATVEGSDISKLPSIPTPPVPTHTDVATVNVYGRSVLDFSVGIVATGLKNHSYYGQASTDSSGKQITDPYGNSPGLIVKEGKKDQADFSTGVFAHYYTTSRNRFNLAGSLGISTGSDLRYLLGPSLAYTCNKTRIFLTSGGAAGKHNVLANDDQVGQFAHTGKVGTDSVMDASWFVALTAVINVN